MRKLLISLLSVLMLFAISVQSVAAWGFYGTKLNGAYQHSWCFNPSYPFPYQSMKDTVTQGVTAWNNAGGAAFEWVKVSDSYFGTSSCQYGISYAPIPDSQGNPLAHTDSPNGAHAFTTFNSRRGGEIYWYQAAQYCNTGRAGNGKPACKSDALTDARHEAGHALGLGHNIIPDGVYVLCQNDHDPADIIGGCVNPPTNLDSYARNVMYWSAGDGYRRPLGSDDIGGEKALYGILIG